VQAVFAALNFSAPVASALSTISRENWPATLTFCDRAGLTVPLYLRSSGSLPPEVRSQIENKLKNNAMRWSRLKRTYAEISSALEANGIAFAVLKGFAQWPLFAGDPRHRSQYDVDVLLQRCDLDRAAAVAANLGFEPAVPRGRRPVVDHFPTLIRKTGWVWRDDYFDPDIPFALELHFRCWDAETEGFGPVNLEDVFWSRLVRRQCEEISFQSLNAADSLLYSSLHALRHLLRGNLRAAHIYEIAWFLHRQSCADEFWRVWRKLFSDELREYQAICFALAKSWFGPTAHPMIEESVSSLPSQVRRWLFRYSLSPLTTHFKANKHEVWLHWSLLRCTGPRFSMIRRRMIPVQLPGPVSAVHLKPQQMTFKIRLEAHWTYLRYLSQRLRHHLASLVPTSISAAVWFGCSWRDRLHHRRLDKP
jgi:hypothetical protein